MVPVDDLDSSHGRPPVPMSATERVKAYRRRRKRREVRLTIDVSKIDLRAIALRGYADAASSDHKLQAEAVSVFVSDMCLPTASGTAARIAASG
jgi:hypothetical protein